MIFAESSSSSSSSSCFPPTAKVEVDDDKLVTLSELRTGDYVKTGIGIEN